MNTQIQIASRRLRQATGEGPSEAGADPRTSQTRNVRRRLQSPFRASRPVEAPVYNGPSPWVHFVVGGKSYSTSWSTLQKKPSLLRDLTAPGSAWHQSGAAATLSLDEDGKTFRHVLDFLRTDRLEKGLPTSTLSGVNKQAKRLDMQSLHLEAKVIYPLRENKRQARGSAAFVGAYVAFSDALFMSGQTEEAQVRWRKLSGLYTELALSELLTKLQSTTEPRRLGLLHLHAAEALSELRPLHFMSDAEAQTHIDSLYEHVLQAIAQVPDNDEARRAVVFITRCPSGISQEHLYQWKVHHLRALVRDTRESADDLVELGRVHEDAGLNQEAISAWQQALCLDEGCLEARYLRAARLRYLGLTIESDEELKILRKLDVDDIYGIAIDELLES